MLDRHHLQIIYWVNELGSLTAAAEQLHLTQSAVSHSIKKLEQQLAVQLWIRDGRKVRLTPEGEALLTLADRILPQFEQVEKNIRLISQGERGTLRIGMECHPCYQWLMQVVPGFLKDNPGVDIDVIQKFQFGGMAALFNYEIDLLVTPDPMMHKGADFVPVFDYEQVLVVGKGHPLAGKSFAEPQDLVSETLITYPVDIDRLDIFTHFLLPAECRPRKHKQIEATEMMLQLVAAGRGVASLPKWLVATYQPTLPVVPVRLGKEGVSKQIHLGSRRQDPAGALASHFVGQLLASKQAV